MRQLTASRYALLFVILFIIRAEAQAPKSHLNLDWQAPRRWVHIDNVDPQKVQLFENARRGWLATLRRGDTLLGDGRPLFWCARSKTKLTYFTLYPFRKWADLDARSEMATQTNEAVGDSAVKTYDTGDAALVPPHGSQIWRRQSDSDIAWPGTDSLSELTAGVGRMEIRLSDFWHWRELDSVWTGIQAALVKSQYPLACRVYGNSFGDGQGETILLWLAADSAQYRNAPSIQTALEKGLGKKKSAELLASLDKYFPLKESYEMEKRLDLSNLGK